MKRAWMPLYIGDYLGDTGHLTTTQHGAYLLLMMHYWRKDELPDDDKQLAKITKLPLKVWTEYRETIQAFFYDGWRHKRIDEEIYKMMTTSEKRSRAGYLGGIKSAMSRMKLEDTSLSKHASRQANAWPGLTPAEARLDHSHSQSKNSKEEGSANGKDEKPRITAQGSQLLQNSRR
jgi:uncharacterized protein YdaU (DUF1376 family)